MKNLFLSGILIIFSFTLEAKTFPTELLSAINVRLSHMQEVALYKAQNQLPIEDIVRERTVIAAVNINAQKQGLDVKGVKAFISAQISVAKAIQYRYRADWLSVPIRRKAKDLKTDIRPELIKLGNQLVGHIVEYIRTYGSFAGISFDDFADAINVDHVSRSDKRLLYNALIRMAPLSK